MKAKRDDDNRQEGEKRLDGQELRWRNRCSPPRPRAIALAARLVVTHALIGLSVLGSAFAEDPLSTRRFVVSEFAWTNAVNSERNYVQKYRANAPSTEPIILWTRVRATPEAMDDLRGEGRLPIWHKWFVSCGSTDMFDGTTRPTDAIDLSISREAVLLKLQTEVDSRGFFDWRTWSKKNRVSSCWYTIRIVDNRNRAVYCEELEADCVLTIKLNN